jgi:hypothetical protein
MQYAGAATERQRVHERRNCRAQARGGERRQRSGSVALTAGISGHLVVSRVEAYGRNGILAARRIPPRSSRMTHHALLFLMRDAPDLRPHVSLLVACDTRFCVACEPSLSQISRQLHP